jgi:TPR repeat protein
MSRRVPRLSPSLPALLRGLLLSLPLLSAAPLVLTPGAAHADARPALAAFRAGEYAKALRLARPLAAKDDPQAMYLLGVMYEQGKGVARDDPTAVKWYAAASRKGNYASAQYNLARMYLDGRGVNKNLPKAREWLNAAAAQGHPESKTLLAELDGGASVARAPARPETPAPAKPEAPARTPAVAAAPAAAPAPISSAARAPDGPAAPPEPANNAAEPIARPPEAVDRRDFPTRTNELSRPAEPAKAPEAAAAKAPQPDKPVQVGKAELPAPRAAEPAAAPKPAPAVSAPTAPPPPAASAAPAASPPPATVAPSVAAAPAPAARPAARADADTPVLAAYRSGDYARALKLAVPLAQREDGPGMYVLGKLYETGQGARRDDYTAVKWLAAASRKANYAPAQYALARMYVDGRGVNKNLPKAKEWLTTAAAQGHAESQQLLAQLGGKPVAVAAAPAVAPAAPVAAAAPAPAAPAAAAKAPEAVAPARPAETKGVESKPAEVKAPEVKAPEVKAAEVRAADAKAPEPRPAEAKPEPARIAEARPAVKAPEAKAPEAKVAETRGAEVRAPDGSFPESRVGESRPQAAPGMRLGDAPQTAMLARPAPSATTAGAGARKEPIFAMFSPAATQASITTLNTVARRSESQSIEQARAQLAVPMMDVAMRYWEAEAAGDRKGMGDARGAITANGPMAIGLAKQWRNSKAGNERAAGALLATLTQSGSETVAEACSGYRMAAEAPGAEHAPALFHAALCEAQRDPKQSLSWLHASADAGHAAALETLGRACIESSDKNWGCAMHYFELAAQRGRGSSMTLYGWVLSNQPSASEKDFTEALNWYRKGASAGDLFAQNNLGEMFERGRGTRRDDKQARQWYGRAAEAGFGPGQFNYARLLLAGVGGPKDKDGAVQWLQKAERNGVSQAKAALAQITASQ